MSKKLTYEEVEIVCMAYKSNRIKDDDETGKYMMCSVNMHLFRGVGGLSVCVCQ